MKHRKNKNKTYGKEKIYVIINTIKRINLIISKFWKRLSTGYPSKINIYSHIICNIIIRIMKECASFFFCKFAKLCSVVMQNFRAYFYYFSAEFNYIIAKQSIIPICLFSHWRAEKKIIK